MKCVRHTDTKKETHRSSHTHFTHKVKALFIILLSIIPEDSVVKLQCASYSLSSLPPNKEEKKRKINLVRMS